MRIARERGDQRLSGSASGCGLLEVVDYARTHSRYFRELYVHLPDRVDDAASLPVTNKKTLMARFDDWMTDTNVTLEDVRAFIGNPTRIGEQFPGGYTALTTSGTSGMPGLFRHGCRWDRRGARDGRRGLDG